MLSDCCSRYKINILDGQLAFNMGHKMRKNMTESACGRNPACLKIGVQEFSDQLMVSSVGRRSRGGTQQQFINECIYLEPEGASGR